MKNKYIALKKIKNFYKTKRIYRSKKWKNIILIFIVIFWYYLVFFSNIAHQKIEYTGNNRCTFIHGKLYWNNETSININKIKEEIKHFHQLKISFQNKTDFIKRKNPKISLIITLHNREKFIKLIYTSIQIQELKDIEIIFVDDASIDNTSLIINGLMANDKRIVYLKNNINRGAFYSRNKGILKSKGEYILVIDSDDLLINNILIKVYETAKKYNLDIVQFYVLIGSFKNNYLCNIMKYKSGILNNNSQIKNNFYKTISRNLWDKLIKGEIYRKSIKFMRNEFYNKLYFINNDDTSFFGLLHVAKTYGFLEQVGYFYYWTPNSSHYRIDPKNMNLIFRSIFNNMKYFYIQSDNNYEEKKNLAYKYFNKNYVNLIKYLPHVTEGIDFILDTLDLYINSSYFSLSEKKKLSFIKSIFINRKKIMFKKK